MKKETIAIVIAFILLAGIISAGMLTSKDYKRNGFLEPQKEAQPEEKDKIFILDQEALTESSLRHFDTTDWLTYKGEENFSFKYPSDNWLIEKRGIYGHECFNEERGVLEECKTNLPVEYSIYGIHEEKPYDVHLIIDVWENPEELSVENWIKKDWLKEETNPNCSPMYCHPLSIDNNIEGLACTDISRLTDPYPSGTIFYRFFLSHKDLIYILTPYEIRCTTSDPDFPDCFLKQEQIYETIVSTFSGE